MEFGLTWAKLDEMEYVTEAEKLGFKLIKTFKNRPSFLGFTFNDDLADESFSVYDHPKATIFENVERFSDQALRHNSLRSLCHDIVNAF